MSENTQTITIICLNPSSTLKKITAHILKGFEMNWLNASHIQQIKSLFEKAHPDLLILDISNLEKNLLEEFKLAMSNLPLSPTLWILGDRDDHKYLPKQQACELLTRPFKPKEYSSALERLGFSLCTEVDQTRQSAHSSSSYKQLQSESPLINTHLKEELEEKMQDFLLEYCKKNFRAIAEEVLTKEIKKLTEEKSKIIQKRQDIHASE